MQTKSVEDCVEPLAEKVAEREGCELVYVEYVHDAGRWILRLFIDRAEGITLTECSAVSRQMSAILDVEDLIPQSYHLEVSSPGLDRPLRNAQDYEKFAGEEVKIRTDSPVEGRRKFSGVLEGLTDDVVVVTDATGEVFQIPFDKVRKARLDPRI